MPTGVKNTKNCAAGRWPKRARTPYVPAAMNQQMKLALDLGPLIAFFASYYLFGLLPATGVLIVATIAAGGISYALVGSVSRLMIFSGLFVVVLGGLTLALDDPQFIKMKPTIYYLTVSAILFVTLLFGRLVLKDVFDAAVNLRDEGWRKLTIRIGLFCIVLAIANELVWRNLPEQVWVWLKVAGFMPVTAIFLALQFYLLIQQYEIPAEETAKSGQGDGTPPGG